MLYRKYLVFLFIFTFWNVISFGAFGKYTNGFDLHPHESSCEINLKSKAYMLADFDSDKVLIEHNGEEIIEPASITKMLTMYIIDNEIRKKRLSLDESVIVSSKSCNVEGSKMFLSINNNVSVRNIIKGIVISSANDGSIAIAEHIAGSEINFVMIMNNYAKAMGMVNSNFMNSTGLPGSSHYTTSRDILILAKAIINDFPESYKLYSGKSFIFNKIKQFNRNKLLWVNAYADGIKTGYSSDAGYCLISSAKKNNTRLISVVFGADNDESRTIESNKLILWGFRAFETSKTLFIKQPISYIDVLFSNKKELKVGIPSSFYITVPKDNINNISILLNLPKYIKAPCKKNDIVGKVIFMVGENAIYEGPVVSLENINKGFYLAVLFDKIIIMLKGFINKNLYY